MAKQGSESLIIEIVWHDNLWQGPCRRPLENDACLPEHGFNIWDQRTYPEREAILRAKSVECKEPSERGHCFGYRVFDEIMMFLANAEGSPVFAGFGPDGLGAAFDAAVLMKVLPKFHGTRGKLRAPLEKIVWWAREPDNPEAGRQTLSDKSQNTEGIAGLRADLHARIEGGKAEESSAAEAFTYPRTAFKALRMLHDLYTTGFASFA